MGNIIFIGFMGSGKTSLAKKVAKHLNWEHLDTDLLLEKKLGLSVPEIFTKEGEDFFREQETKLLHELIGLKNKVISVGGGLPCFNNNIDKLNEIGKTYYLKLSPKELAKRLKEAKTERPLISNLEEGELEYFIEKRLIEREVFYSLADFTLIGKEYSFKNFLKILDN